MRVALTPEDPKEGEVWFVMKKMFEWGDCVVGTRRHPVNEINSGAESKVPKFLWCMRLGQ